MKKIIFLIAVLVTFLEANYFEVKIGGAWPSDLKSCFNGEILYGFEIDEMVSMNIRTAFLRSTFTEESEVKQETGADYARVSTEKNYSDILPGFNLRVSIDDLMGERFTPYAQIGGGMHMIIHTYETDSDEYENGGRLYIGWNIDIRAGINMKLGSKTTLSLSPGVMLGKAEGKDYLNNALKQNLNGFYILAGFGFDI